MTLEWRRLFIRGKTVFQVISLCRWVWALLCLHWCWKRRQKRHVACRTHPGWYHHNLPISCIYPLFLGSQEQNGILKKKATAFLSQCLCLNSINRWEFLAVPSPGQLHFFLLRDLLFIFIADCCCVGIFTLWGIWCPNQKELGISELTVPNENRK